MTVDVTHLPERPSWRCRVCREPWPCKPSKADLIATMDRVGRVIYMNSHMADAISDQAEFDATDMYDRFIGWARAS